MPRIVLDTTIIVPAVLGYGRKRQLLIALTYNRRRSFAETGHVEAEEQRRLSAEHGGEVGGRTYDAAIRQAQERASSLGELLPVGIPDDLIMVCSNLLFAEYS